MRKMTISTEAAISIMRLRRGSIGMAWMIFRICLMDMTGSVVRHESCFGFFFWRFEWHRMIESLLPIL